MEPVLDVDRHQVAEHQAGRVEISLAEGDGRELDGQRTGREHPAFHRLEHLREMAMAIVETAAMSTILSVGFVGVSAQINFVFELI